MADPAEISELRRTEYDLRRRVGLLRIGEYTDVSVGENGQGVEDFLELEAQLATVIAARLKAEAAPGTSVAPTLAIESTGLSATVELRMAYVPTATVHLFDPAKHPLVTVTVRRAPRENSIRRIRITVIVDGYSAAAVESLELGDGKPRPVDLLPTFFPDAFRKVTELTRATLSTLVEDLDTQRVEIHRTSPVWLLARNTAALSVADPAKGVRVDLTPYLGAFVTPNSPAVIGFLRKVAARHPDQRLVGYQGSPDAVEPQVRALYEALAADAGVTYVNSVIAFDPEEGSASQRVRLPRESLAEGSANCLDGTLLYASLLEAMSLRPALVLIPGHAIIAWETWTDSGEWKHLETTKTSSQPFNVACQLGESVANRYAGDGQGRPNQYRRLPLRELRVEQRITPME